MSNIKNGDRVVTPEGNIGVMLESNYGFNYPAKPEMRTCAIVLDHGKREFWDISVIKPHKEKRPFDEGDEVWVKGIIYSINRDCDGELMVTVNTSRYPEVAHVIESDVFHKEDIPND